MLKFLDFSKISQHRNCNSWTIRPERCEKVISSFRNIRKKIKIYHYLLDNIHAFDNLSENNMFAIKPWGLGRANEKLGTVSVGSGIGHGQNSRSGVLQLEVFVLELVAVNGFSTSSIVVGEISTLTHEVGDHAVESGAFIAETLLSSAESTEILSRFGDYIGPQLKIG